MTRNPGIVISLPPSVMLRAPPMVHNTTIKVSAESTAWKNPAAKSTGASVPTRKSSAMRYSGLP
jgi:hypothetical protein